MHLETYVNYNVQKCLRGPLRNVERSSPQNLGTPEYYALMAANSRKGYWRTVNTTTVKRALSKERLIRSGFYDLAIAYQSVHVNY